MYEWAGREVTCSLYDCHNVRARATKVVARMKPRFSVRASVVLYQEVPCARSKVADLRRRQFELSQSVSYFTVSRSALPPPPAKLSPLAAAATCSRKYVQFMTNFLDKLQYCIQ